jgi:UDP-N-acetylmuramate--alanine ligase
MATLAGLRELFPDKKVTAIFQPHLFSRTKSLFKEFSESFNDADRIILLPIYKAREFDDGTVSSEKLMEEIVKKGKDAIYFDTFEQVTSFLHNTAGGNDVVITLGAGDVYHVGEQYLKSGAKK